MPNDIVYDEMCRQCECEHYIEWEFEYDMVDWNCRHRSVMICVSCQVVGQSENITEYPEECPFKYELDRYMEIKTEELRKFRIKMEKQKIWKIKLIGIKNIIRN